MVGHLSKSVTLIMNYKCEFNKFEMEININKYEKTPNKNV